MDIDGTDLELDTRDGDARIVFRGTLTPGPNATARVGVGCDVELRRGRARAIVHVLDVFPDGTFIGEVRSVDGSDASGLGVGADVTFKERHVFACERRSAAA